MTISPLGGNAYVAGMGSDSALAFAIDPNTGSLTEMTGSPFPMGAGTAPRSIAIMPTDEAAFVLLSGSNSLAAFTQYNGQVIGSFTGPFKQFFRVSEPRGPGPSISYGRTDRRLCLCGERGFQYRLSLCGRPLGFLDRCRWLTFSCRQPTKLRGHRSYWHLRLRGQCRLQCGLRLRDRCRQWVIDPRPGFAVPDRFTTDLGHG